MALDAITLRAIALELTAELVGGRVDRVYQPEKDELLIVVRLKEGVKTLLIGAGGPNARVYLSRFKKENPSEPPMFCMLLRKHLTGARIVAVNQLNFDRVIDLLFEVNDETGALKVRHLICEIMGSAGNIIFTDENRTVIDALRRLDEEKGGRIILPRFLYAPPPDTGRLSPETAALSELEDALFAAPMGQEAGRAVVGAVSGISPLLAREAVFEATGDASALMGELTAERKKRVAQKLFDMFERAKRGEFTPCLLTDRKDDRAVEFSAFFIKQYGEVFAARFSQSCCEVAEAFYHKRAVEARIRQKGASVRKVLNNAAERCKKKLALQQGELKAAGEREKFKIEGDIISANLHRIKRGDSELTARNFYAGDAPEITIALDETLSPSQNAQSRYKRYQKAKNAQRETAKQIELTLAEMDYLQSVLLALDSARTTDDLAQIGEELRRGGYIKSGGGKRKKQPETFLPAQFEFEGYQILAGRNNLQNDYLTLKMGRSRDMWLHAKNLPGSHVLIKYAGEPFPPKVIETAAVIAACFSKAKAGGKAEVDYCPVKNVKKPAQARAGMVVYEGYNTAVVTPDAALVKKLQK